MEYSAILLWHQVSAHQKPSQREAFTVPKGHPVPVASCNRERAANQLTRRTETDLKVFSNGINARSLVRRGNLARPTDRRSLEQGAKIDIRWGRKKRAKKRTTNCCGIERKEGERRVSCLFLHQLLTNGVCHIP